MKKMLVILMAVLCLTAFAASSALAELVLYNNLTVQNSAHRLETTVTALRKSTEIRNL